ncbi:hypothetical protein SKAU_G00009960 [Synaphobranchus kaupii]|uniref:Uncharacterized protein n=1 Tax=Synaphobranchus kaupii TaxID=118154 RepID=A0A9Q1JC29_SYNKA|nr:hypothetical protein SKAU_G00009960 [Synaphobranchus kaupii]
MGSNVRSETSRLGFCGGTEHKKTPKPNRDDLATKQDYGSRGDLVPKPQALQTSGPQETSWLGRTVAMEAHDPEIKLRTIKETGGDN